MKNFTGFKQYIPYAFIFGAGMGAAHFWRAKTLEPEHRNRKDVAGEDLGVMKMGLDAGAHMKQKFAPLQGIHQHVCGFHFYAGDMQRQIAAHHYCHHINNDVNQCVIYDSDKPDARLIGIEYIISDRLYKTLPEDEKKLWHSHIGEVKSGLLYAPMIPEIAEHQVMQELVNTYGKTFHTWQIDRGDTLPLGIPQLMWAFTDESQMSPETIKIRNTWGNPMENQKKRREDIKVNPKDPSSDPWEKGKTPYLTLGEKSQSMYSKSNK